MKTEQKVLQYIQSKQIDITLLSVETGLSEQLFSEKKPLEWSADEFLRVCSYLEIDPWFFSDNASADRQQKNSAHLHKIDQIVL